MKEMHRTQGITKEKTRIITYFSLRHKTIQNLFKRISILCQHILCFVFFKRIILECCCTFKRLTVLYATVGHWLPVKVRSTYKIACLCYHCHSSTAPSYVTDMLHKKPLHTRNTRSSSYTMPLLNRPAHSKATLGDRSFSFASSSVWNSIPNDVRCAPSLSSFKSRLKTYLFRLVYID